MWVSQPIFKRHAGSTCAVLLSATLLTGVTARAERGAVEEPTLEALLRVDGLRAESIGELDPVPATDAPASRVSDAYTTTSLTSPDDVNWSGEFRSPLSNGIDGTVWALLVHAETLIAAGDFANAGSVLANNIAAWDGVSWSPLSAGMNDVVFSLAVYQGDLIAGGWFTEAGGAAAAFVARWDGTSWSPLGEGVDGPVRALVVHDGKLIAGGDFSQAGGAPAQQIASWDGASWSPLGGGFTGGFSGLGVRSLEVHGGSLVAGGFFTLADGSSANRLAIWDGTTWTALGSWLHDSVYSLLSTVGGLVAGSVVWVEGTGGWSELIRIWDGSFWNTLGSGSLAPPFSNAVRALVEYGGELYAAGGFPLAGGVPAHNIARWNGTSWQDVGGGTNANVYAMALFQGSLFIGGDFMQVGGVDASHIAAWDGTSWITLDNPAPGVGMDGGVWALTVHDDKLIAGGEFSQAGTSLADFVAAFDGTSWSALGSGMDDRVFALAEYEGELIAGGDFTTAGGVQASHVASWDGSSWHALGSGVDGPVRALIVHQGTLIVGGDFEMAGGAAARKIARWDGSSWNPMGQGFHGGFGDLGVRSLAVFKRRLYAGGHFLASGKRHTPFIARWNGRKWTAVGSGRLPRNGRRVTSKVRRGLVGTAYALHVHDDRLTAGSVVWREGLGSWGDMILSWPGWRPLGSGPLAPPFSNAIRALTTHNSDLIAAGGFPLAAGEPVNSIARWNGSSWTSLGSGLGGNGQALAVFQGSLYVGGEFIEAGNKPSLYIARWDDPAGLVENASDQRGLRPGEESTRGRVQILSDGAGVRFSFEIDAESATLVQLEIFDARGQRLRTIARGVHGPGVYVHSWDRRDESGIRVARGVYFVSFKAGEVHTSRKLVLLYD